MQKNCGSVLLALSALAVVLPAWGAPNFTGEWKMNPSKSDFGQMPAPQSMTHKIEHKDPSLRVATTQVGEQGETKSETKYTTDGAECSNEVRGNQVKSVLSWDGDALRFRSKLNMQGTDINISDQWALSEDGKVLTINRHVEAPQGSVDLRIVYDKQ